MPLHNIRGVTDGNNVIQLGLVSLSGGKESDDDWILVHLMGKMTAEGISFPPTIITSRELSLMKSLEIIFFHNTILALSFACKYECLGKIKRIPSATN